MNEFRLSLEDVVGATTDGAAVMVKFGKDLGVIHQTCNNHAFHLAVMDVIFRKSVADEDMDSGDGDDNDRDSDLFNDDDEDDDNEDETDIYGENNEDILEMREDLKSVLSKVRKIVMLIKRSPVKNNVFQNHVKEQHGKEMSLLMDCRTRWNSTEIMIARFNELYSCILLALTDLNAAHFLMDDSIPLLREFSNCLRPIKMAVESLGKRNCDLLKSEGILKFVFEELKRQSSDLSKEILCSLKLRVNERRNKEIVSIIKYLKTKDLSSTPELPYKKGHT